MKSRNLPRILIACFTLAVLFQGYRAEATYRSSSIEIDNAENSAPAFTSAPVLTGTQGTLYSYSITADDPDEGDTLTITAPTKPSWLTLTDHGDGTATLAGTPANDDVGDNDVVLRVEDSQNASDTQPFTIDVENVNDPPTDIALSNNTVEENKPVGTAVGVFTTTDPDIMHGDTHTYLLANGDGSDDNASFEITGNTLTTKAVFNFESKPTYNIRVKSTDSGEESFAKPFVINILDVNEPPSFTSNPVLTGTQGTLYSYAITADDPDEGDTLAITAPTKPSWLTLTDHGDGTATLAGTPANDDVGDNDVVLRVEDSQNASDTQPFTIDVENVNDPPVALHDPYAVEWDQTLAVPAPGVLSNDSDVDGDALTAVKVPESGPNHGNLVLNPNGSFTYIPNPTFIGTDTFQYQAFDGKAHSNVAEVEITVYDDTKPTVQWLAPVPDGSIYDVANEKVILKVQVADDLAVTRVHFFWWDYVSEQFIDIAHVFDPPEQVEVEFDATNLNVAWNQIFARAYDGSGNMSARPWVWLFKEKQAYRTFLPVVTH